MSNRNVLQITLAIAALVLLCGSAWAATPAADTLKVDYFANANTSSPDSTVRIINPGTTYANLCANVYVFDTHEELSECCSCTVTPDGILQLSVNTDLTANPLTGVTLNTGVIKVVSASPVGGLCPVPANANPTPALRVWTTHVQSGNAITETESGDATLSANEVTALNLQCKDIKQVGSGKGICANSGALAAICNN
jgi:hypothetical protein